MGTHNVPTTSWNVGGCFIACGNKDKPCCKDCFKLQDGTMSCFIPAKGDNDDMPEVSD